LILHSSGPSENTDTIKDAVTKALGRERLGQGFSEIAMTNTRATIMDNV
jgi:hypothetical protein